MSAEEVKTSAQTVVTLTDHETGEEKVITDQDIAEILNEETDNSALTTYIESCYEIVESYGGGLCCIDLHPPKSTVVNSDTVPILISEDNSLKPGIYYALYEHENGHNFSESELFSIEKATDNGLLLASDTDQVIGDGINFMPVTVAPLDDNGEIPENPPYDPLYVYIMRVAETGAYVTVNDFLKGLTANAAVNIALEKMERDGSLTVARQATATGEALLSINSTAIDEIDFTTDKMNRETWNQWAKLEPGQLAMGFAEDGSAGLEIHLETTKDKERGLSRVMTYDICFDELESLGIAPRLDPYDRRVYEALSSLWNHVTSVTGQETFSLKDVHYAMGFTSNPGVNAKKKINDSITKMSKAHIAVDNYNETQYYNYPHFKYDSSLLPMERITGYVDGQITDGLIHLFREPPLFTFARERKQFTTYNIQLLQTPLSKTNKNLLIEDYLREQIAWMKNSGKSSNRNNKITFADMFKETGIKRRDDRARQKKNAAKVLSHYEKCGWIDGFEETKDGFKIFY